MAITNGYCTLDEYKEYARLTRTDENDDTLIESMIEDASRLIEQETGVKFYSSAVTLYFDYPKSRKLKFDKWLQSVTSITNGDGNAISSSLYNLLPYDGPPYHSVKLLDTSTTYWLPTSAGSYEKCITVVGTDGYASSAPSHIYIACMDIVKNAYNRRLGKNTETTETITAAGIVVSPIDIPTAAARRFRSYKQRM